MVVSTPCLGLLLTILPVFLGDDVKALGVPLRLAYSFSRRVSDTASSTAAWGEDRPEDANNLAIREEGEYAVIRGPK